MNLRHRVYEILEHGTIGDRTGLIVGRLIVVLIIINLVAITLESVPNFQTEMGRYSPVLKFCLSSFSPSNTDCGSGLPSSTRRIGICAREKRDGSSF